MHLTHLTDCPLFTAGDGTMLRELLHPGKSPLKLRYSLAHATLAAGKISFLHELRFSEVYYILSGRGRMEIDGEFRDVSASDTIYIPPNAKQRIESLGPDDLEFLCIVDPAWQPHDEIIYENNKPK